MARVTTAYFTLEVERIGRSGPENERQIEKLVQRWMDELSRGTVNVTIGHHDYLTQTETIE